MNDFRWAVGPTTDAQKKVYAGGRQGAARPPFLPSHSLGNVIFQFHAFGVAAGRDEP